MKNEETKQQETTAQCAICVVLRCAWKWLLAAGLISLVAELMLITVILFIQGNETQGDWATTWVGTSFITCFVAGLTALLTYWKDAYNWVRDELRCA